MERSQDGTRLRWVLWTAVWLLVAPVAYLLSVAPLAMAYRNGWVPPATLPVYVRFVTPAVSFANYGGAAAKPYNWYLDLWIE